MKKKTLEKNFEEFTKKKRYKEAAQMNPDC